MIYSKCKFESLEIQEKDTRIYKKKKRKGTSWFIQPKKKEKNLNDPTILF